MNFYPPNKNILKHAFLTLALAAVSTAFGQTLTVTAGQGQLIPSVGISAPISVLLLDGTGQPVPNQFVTFTSSNPSAGNPSAPSALTDSTGTATTTYIGASLQNSFIPYLANTVVATAGTLSTSVYITTVGQVNGGGNAVTVQLINPPQGSGVAISGAAGTTATAPIQISVLPTVNSGGFSVGVPFVSLVVAVDSSSSGSFACKEGSTILTDSNGVGVCTPVFGKVGNGTYTITIGGGTQFTNLPFQVTVGAPGLIQITSGNNQSGSPGTTLPLPLVAIVTDLGGNPIPGVAMVFTSVTPGGATFTNVRTSSDSSGKVSANVVLGNVPGTVQISLVDAAGQIKTPAIFTETVNLTITGISKSAGDQQTAIVNAQFASPLVAHVTAGNNQSPAGTLVQFAVSSGSATLSATSVTVDSSGNASTTVTAGGTAGPVVITATTGVYNTAFNLTVAPPGPSNISFTNNASGVVNSLSPGSVVTIYGSGIAPSVQGVVGSFVVGPLPYTVAGVSVKFGSFNAPIFGVGNTNGSQFVTVQVPFELPFGATPVTITTAGGANAIVQANVAAASPGLFEYIGTDNAKNVVALRPNGSVVGPSNPAIRGESIRFYVTGAGPVSPSVGTNSFSPSPSDPTVVYPIVLGISNNGTSYSQAIYARNLIGVEEITFTVPSDATPGKAGISIGVIAPTGIAYSQGSAIYIQ